MTEKKTVTISDVAQHVGLAKSTVALAMSGKAADVGLASKTVDRIEAAAKELGYERNYWARSLARRSSDIVTVLMDVFASYYGDETMYAISKVLTEKSYFPFLAADWRDPLFFKKAVAAAIERRDAGMVCHSSTGTKEQYQRIMDSGIPLVFVGDAPRILEGRPDINIVTWDDGQAVETAVEHLVAVGRRKIGFVGADHGYDSDSRRLAAFRDALEKRGLEVRDQWQAWFRLEPVDFSSVEEVLGCLFPSEKDSPDALLTINNAVALEVQRGMTKRGLRIPEEVALITLCNCPSTKLAGITAVREPVAELAENAAEMLVELIENPEAAPLRKNISCNDLLLRKSTAL